MKILIVRFSSIGDIVLTTPVIRCLKEQLTNVEIHFLSKTKFESVIKENPYLDKIWLIEKNTSEVIRDLQNEKFDLIIDLHHNLRTAKLKLQLKTQSYSFDKLNFRKWLKTIFKPLSLPNLHIVDRYLETVKTLGVKNDGKGLDYFIHEKDWVVAKEFNPILENKFVALVIGGSYFTKQIPKNKLIEICTKLKQPAVLLGGKEEEMIGKEIELMFPHVINACGRFKLNQSASILKQAEWVISSDTGLMHIASAFKKKILSIWGNTIPEFGMSPYLPGEGSKIIEVKNLNCRPCSKLGYKSCPKKHFNCMNKINVEEIFNEG